MADNSTFTFTKTVESGATYAVLAQNQPSSTQTCVVTNGSGTVGAAKVTNVSVPLSATTVAALYNATK